MKERISTLMDGELDDRAAAQVIAALAADREALEAWHAYHVIGDALRANPLLSEGFTARVAQQIAQEPAVLAPRRFRPQPRAWYAMAASAAGVALVGWLAFATHENPVAPVAQAPASTTATRVALPSKPVPPVLPLPSGTPDYLLAHQAFSPRVSLQGVAPYARTVSEQVQESGK